MNFDFSIYRTLLGGFVVFDGSGEPICAGSLKICLDTIEQECKDGAGIKRQASEDAPR